MDAHVRKVLETSREELRSKHKECEVEMTPFPPPPVRMQPRCCALWLLPGLLARSTVLPACNGLWAMYPHPCRRYCFFGRFVSCTSHDILRGHCCCRSCCLGCSQAATRTTPPTLMGGWHHLSQHTILATNNTPPLLTSPFRFSGECLGSPPTEKRPHCPRTVWAGPGAAASGRGRTCGAKTYLQAGLSRLTIRQRGGFLAGFFVSSQNIAGGHVSAR